MKDSKFQLDIFQEFQETKNNIVVGAVAGSGKTTTIRRNMQLVPDFKDQAFIVFSREMKNETEKKIKQPNISVNTIHGLGMRSLIRHFNKRLDVSDSKIWMLAQKVNKNKWGLKSDEFSKTVVRIRQMVDLWRMTLCKDALDIIRVADSLGIDYKPEEIGYVMDLAAEYEAYNINPEVVDFTDMVHLPATIQDIKIADKSRIIYVDECQDLNACQHLFVDKFVHQNRARWMAVGDRNQSIFGFTGAHTRSFDLFIDKDQVIEKPLSICYRCDHAIIEDANTVYDVMIPFEGNGPGIVEYDGDRDDIKEGDMVICRNTKPLIQMFFWLVKKRKKAFIKGKDISRGLIQMVKPHSGKTTSQLRVIFDKKMTEKLDELRERDIKNPMNHPTFCKLEEKVEVIMYLSDQFDRADDLIKFLEDVFSDEEKDGVMLSTIHRSKGLEADVVFFLNQDLIPSKYARTPDQRRQEDNLRYVAITRAKSKLSYIYI